ncbi:MAG: hypothetical protein KJO17_09190 [Acidimicrobiia bacterium]|nr:hypothetical protein [Acidimicrobiia bacterium]NNL70269.1 hypothetical protein [Acidimicrobiia bacterium]
MDDVAKDPFEYCEGRTCAHDLANGVLIAELLAGDGPYRPNHFTDRVLVLQPPPPIHEAA